MSYVTPYTALVIGCCFLHHGPFIGGFRDTYLGRQVVSSPEAGMGSAGVWGALRALLAGSGAEPQLKSNLVPF